MSGIGADVAHVLREVLAWRMSAGSWRQVDALLAGAERALAEGDVDELAALASELVLLGPDRIVALDGVGAPPPAVRDRLNRLVHQLGDVLATGEPAPHRPTGEEAPAARRGHD
jgi:hypothetical protein